MYKEPTNRKNDVSDNKGQSSTPVEMVSNDCCLSAEVEKPQINQKPKRKMSSEMSIKNLQRTMRKAFEAQELLEVTMEQMSKQMQEMERKKQTTNKGVHNGEELSAVEDEEQSATSSESDENSEDVIFVKCSSVHRDRSHDRAHSRGRSRGHSRGNSRGRSRGHSRGNSRGRSRGHSRGNSRGRSRGHSRGNSRGRSRSGSHTHHCHPREDMPLGFHGKHLHSHHGKMMMYPHGAEHWFMRGKSAHKHHGKHQHKYGKHFMGKRAQWTKGHKLCYPIHKIQQNSTMH